MSSKFQSICASIEEMIRNGEVAQAREALELHRNSRPSRPVLSQLSGLARRVQKPELGALWLHPLVRGSNKAPPSATPQETLEYANCLNVMGSNAEAYELLSALDSSEVPEALLYQTFALTPQWRYADTIPLLTKFLNVGEIDPYLRLVALTNICDALVYEKRHIEIRPLLSDLIHNTSLKKYGRLHANALQIAGMDALLRKSYDEAEQFLDRAEKVVESSLDQLFIRKWRAKGAVLKEEASKKSLSKLRAVRDSAEKLSHWETLRDCDRFVATHTKDLELGKHVFFGTPHKAFKERFAIDAPFLKGITDSYLWNVASGNSEDFFEFKNYPELKPGYLIYNTIVTMTEDFYRPARLASIAHKLYPTESYHPLHSPKKVHEAIRRTRNWFQEQHLPLSIVEHEGLYRLEALRPFGVRVQLERETTERKSDEIETLRSWATGSFSAKEAETVLKVSSRSIRRILQNASEMGLVEKEGKGPNTRYRFKSTA